MVGRESKHVDVHPKKVCLAKLCCDLKHKDANIQRLNNTRKHVDFFKIFKENIIFFSAGIAHVKLKVSKTLSIVQSCQILLLMVMRKSKLRFKGDHRFDKQYEEVTSHESIQTNVLSDVKIYFSVLDN